MTENTQIIAVNADTQTVSARDLYETLKVKKRFSSWFDTNSQGFIEGEDFTSVLSSTVVNNGAVREIDDYQLSVDMAKHICLMSRTEEGKKLRQYFIDLEKAWNTPEQVFARALKLADERIHNLNLAIREKDDEILGLSQAITELEPKVNYMDIILQSKSTVTVTQIAQDYGFTARKFNSILHDLHIQRKVRNQWVLYEEYLRQGYTHSKTVEFKRSNGRTDTKMYTEWTQKGRWFLYETLKAHGYLPTIEQKTA